MCIKGSKTNQLCLGSIMFLGVTGSTLCPVAALLDYLNARARHQAHNSFNKMPHHYTDGLLPKCNRLCQQRECQSPPLMVIAFTLAQPQRLVQRLSLNDNKTLSRWRSMITVVWKSHRLRLSLVTGFRLYCNWEGLIQCFLQQIRDADLGWSNKHARIKVWFEYNCHDYLLITIITFNKLHHNHYNNARHTQCSSTTHCPVQGVSRHR